MKASFRVFVCAFFWAMPLTCLFAQETSVQAGDIFLAQARANEGEVRGDDPFREKEKGKSKDRDTNNNNARNNDENTDRNRGNERNGDRSNDRKTNHPPRDRRRGRDTDRLPPDPPSHPYAHAQRGQPWENYFSLSALIPIVSRDYGDEGSFGGAGGGMGFSLHKVNPENHFAMLIRMGLALVSGELSGDFEDNYEQNQDASIGEVTSFYSYFRFGLGGAIEPSGDASFVLIPTAGVGVSYSTMSADVSVRQVYPTGVFEDSYEGTGGECTFDVFVDLTALFMFTGNFGLSASCEVAVNAVGIGDFDGVSYNILPPSFTVTPAVSLCFRF